MLMEVPLVDTSAPFSAELDTYTDTILYWYNGVVADLGDPGLTVQTEPEPQPWNLYDPNEPLWDTTPPLRILLEELASRTAATTGVTATGVLFQQQQLLDFMNRKDRSNGCEEQANGDVGGSAGDAGVGVAVACGGSGVVSGGSENGDTLGEPPGR